MCREGIESQRRFTDRHGIMKWSLFFWNRMDWRLRVLLQRPVGAEVRISDLTGNSGRRLLCDPQRRQLILYGNDKWSSSCSGGVRNQLMKYCVCVWKRDRQTLKRKITNSTDNRNKSIRLFGHNQMSQL